MIFINLDDLENAIPQKLKDDLATAHAELTSAHPSKRSTIIKKYRHLWSDIKQYFENHRSNKCWYTESKNPGCDKDIDHYRPKNEVYEDPDHPGYWWLAFDWRNYRFSCQFTNRLRTNPDTEIVGGKGTHFPLVDDAKRAYAPSDDVTDEKPKLLDPCILRDTKLLWFDPDGSTTINPRYKNNHIALKRLEESRKLMNLDFPTFTDDRQKLYARIASLVRQGDIFYRKSTENDDQTAELAFDGIVTTLWTVMQVESPYSAAACSYIRGFKNKEWIEAILN